jgi:hypothetical protein
MPIPAAANPKRVWASSASCTLYLLSFLGYFVALGPMLDKNGQPSPSPVGDASLREARGYANKDAKREHPLIVVGDRGSSKQGCPFLSTFCETPSE